MPARNRRLPRHLSWPLTPTDLREALGARELEAVDLYFGEHPASDGHLLSVLWSPRPSSSYSFGGTRPPWWSHVRIGVGPVPATERAVTRHALQQDALPELAAWITAARRAPEAWTLSRHTRHWHVEDGAVTRCDEGLPPG
ncbi:hypothetical protein [Kitasatospora sp. NPDC094011]|uniref:hypothetical protein n=1 Tax=Kitasatospora sp. NPDC094011 TaxID=3364090 RepID=UPI00382BF168